MAEEHKESTQRIRVICESCGKIYRVSPQSIGKKAKCACGHSFLLRQVTEPESVVSTPEARLAAQPPRTAVNQRIMWFLLATLFASIALVTTGSNKCLIASNGSILPVLIVSPANESFNPTNPTILPAGALST